VVLGRGAVSRPGRRGAEAVAGVVSADPAPPARPRRLLLREQQPAAAAVVRRGPPHEQPARDQVQEHRVDPAGHPVSAGRAVVHVEHEDGDDDGEGHEDHSEEEVLADERDDERRGRDDLGDEEEEDCEGEQHGDAQGDLLAAVGGEVEHQDREAGDQQAGDDEVDGVEQGEPSDDEEVGDVRVDLVAAVVFLGVVRAHGVDDGPLAALPVVVQVHRVLGPLQVDLGLVVRPGAKFHFAVLLIEGEEGDVDAAGALVNGRRDPADFTRVEEVGFGHVGHGELSISAGKNRDLHFKYLRSEA